MHMERFNILLLVIICSLHLYSQNNQVQRILSETKDAVFTVYANLDNGISQGSGFFISTDGVGITNYHVLDDANSAYILTGDGKKYNISNIVDYDANMDLVKFKIKANPDSKFKALEIQRGLPQQGSSILSLSTPIGLEATLSTGIISALRNDDIHGAIIQITAPISHGSSGSPVMDMTGTVVGVATFGFEQGQSLNFAVAANNIYKMQRSLNLLVSEMGRDPLETMNVKNARKYLQIGEYPKALASLHNEIALNPKNHLALDSYSKCIYASIPYIKHESVLSMIKDAISCSLQACSLDSSCSEYFYQKGLVFTALGMKDEWIGDEGKYTFISAMDAFNKSFKLDTTNISAIYGMAKILCEASFISSKIDFTQEERKANLLFAIDLLSNFERVSPSEGCYNYLISAYVNLKEIGKAVICCDRAIGFNPNWYRGYFLRGDIKIFEMDMFNDGLLDLERALTLCYVPTDKADIYALRATAYEQKAFEDRERMAFYVANALSDYQKAYELTRNPKYLRYKDELANKFNSSKVSKDNL